MSERTEKIQVPTTITPVRLDTYLVTAGLGLSRNQIQKLIRDKNIEIPGKGVKPAFILYGGEEIIVRIPEKEPLRLKPEDIPLDIPFEDEHLLVVNKPPGMVVHPARGHFSGTLVHALLSHTSDLSAIGGQSRPGIIHRLDRDTSGLLIVAKSDIAHSRLARELSARRIKREYSALVWGHMPKQSGSIEGDIGHNPKDHKKMAVVKSGKPARTDYTVEMDYDLLSLVVFRLHTGRTHQIRVHAQHVGHPVFGDPDYGGREQRMGGIIAEERPLARKLLDNISRQALHARRLSFQHPISSDLIEVVAPLPEDMTAVINMLRESRI